MDCKELREQLSSYLDNVLPEDEMNRLKEHLLKCSDCQKELAELQKTVNILKSLEEIVPPASFRRELRSKLEKAQKTTLANKWLSYLSRRSVWMPVAAAAFVLLLVLLPMVSNPLLMKQSKNYIAMDENITGSNQKVGMYSVQGAPDGRGGAAPESAIKDDASIQMKMKEAASSLPEIPDNIEQKIIKNADFNLEVDNYDTAVAALKQKVVAIGGYIANESMNTVGPEKILSGYLQVRIPAADFENFLASMEGIGKVNHLNIYCQDVTEEYFDVESRLKAFRTKEERLIAILQKSGQLSDVLAVENELANTRAQLESLEGRLRYLNNRTELSSISINLTQVAVSSQNISATGLTGLWDKMKEAFIKTINKILVDTGKFIVLVTSILPYLFLIGLLGYGVWLWTKKKGM